MMPTPEQREADDLARRRAMFEPREPSPPPPASVALPPRRAHVQRTEARAYGEPGGNLGTIAWEEHVAACRRRRVDPERMQCAGGLDYAAVTMLLGHEPRTWERR